MELKIFYSHYNTKNAVKKDRPDWFSFESCLVNLLDTIKESNSKIKIRLFLVFDGDEASFFDDFSSKYFDLKNQIVEGNLTKEVRLIKAGDAFVAAHQLLDMVFNEPTHSPDDLVYTLENDYLHVPGWLECVEDLVNSDINFHYLTLYDHADKYRHTSSYNGKYDRLKSQIYVTPSRHWRTTPSTCFSLISKAKFLQEDKLIYKNLRDQYVQPFLRLIRGRILVSAIPGLSTHCMSRYLSPLIDWHKISTKASCCNVQNKS